MDRTMSWYKVTMLIPGTDGDGENGMCEPDTYIEMVYAHNEEIAKALANAEVDIPFDAPVAVNAEKASEKEYADWKAELDMLEEMDKCQEPAMRWV